MYVEALANLFGSAIRNARRQDRVTVGQLQGNSVVAGGTHRLGRRRRRGSDPHHLGASGRSEREETL